MIVPLLAFNFGLSLSLDYKHIYPSFSGLILYIFRLLYSYKVLDLFISRNPFSCRIHSLLCCIICFYCLCFLSLVSTVEFSSTIICASAPTACSPRSLIAQNLDRVLSSQLLYFQLSGPLYVSHRLSLAFFMLLKWIHCIMVERTARSR
jgi:hypothetical protein